MEVMTRQKDVPTPNSEKKGGIPMKWKKDFEIVPYMNPLATVFSPSAEAVLVSMKPELAYNLLREQFQSERAITRNTEIYGALSSAASSHSHEVVALIQTRKAEDKDFYLDTVTTIEPEHSKLLPVFGTSVIVSSSSRGGWRK